MFVCVVFLSLFRLSCCFNCVVVIFFVFLQSPLSEALEPRWKCLKCFFEDEKLIRTDDIYHYDRLEGTDQKLIQDKISSESKKMFCEVPGGDRKPKGSSTNNNNNQQ